MPAERGEKRSFEVLLPSGLSVACSLYDVWPLPGMNAMLVSSLSKPLINFHPDTYGLLYISLSVSSYKVLSDLPDIIFAFFLYVSLLSFYLPLLLPSRFPHRSLFVPFFLIQPFSFLRYPHLFSQSCSGRKFLFFQPRLFLACLTF